MNSEEVDKARQALVDGRCIASLDWVDKLFTAGKVTKKEHDELIQGFVKLGTSSLNKNTVELINGVLLGEVAPPPDPNPQPQPGYPTITNTGPKGTLKPSGTIETTHDGQVIQNLQINGEIRVQHNNVRVLNCGITSQGGHAIFILNNTGLVVEDCALDGQGRNAEAAIAHHNYTMRRCRVRGYGEGPRINGNVTIEDCLIHEFANFISQGAHQDGIQGTSGSNVVIRHNVILVEPDGANGGIFFSTSNGDSILIEDNVVGGGNWAINLDHNLYRNVRILRNRITTKIPYHPLGGFFGPITPSRGENWTVQGNVWHDGPNAGKLLA